MTKKCLLPGFWLVLLALGTAATAAADYEASYVKGLEALEREQWQEAAVWFRQAIEERPQAGGRVFAGGGRELYVPYHQLGLALYHAGELWEASQAWRQSAVQGVRNRKMEELANQYLFEIEQRLADGSESGGSQPQEALPPKLTGAELDRRKRDVEAQIARAQGQVEALAAPAMQKVVDADPALSRQRDEGLERLRLARQIYDKAGKGGDPIALLDVHERAVTAAGVLERVVFSATRAVIANEKEAEAAEALAASAAPPQTAPLVSGSEVPSVPNGASTERATPSDSIQETPTRDEDSLGTPLPLPEPPPLPGEDLTPTPPQSGPPAFLREAAEAFFSARYEETLARLADAGELRDRRARKHAHLFRAASHFALYLLSSRRDASHLAAAEAEVRACRAIDPELQPPVEGFSPSFVEFFHSIG